MNRLVSIITGLAALGLGVAALAGLTAYGRSKQAQPEPPQEDTLHVRAAHVAPASYPVTINGFGTVSALREVALAVEVSGLVLETHPNFVEGGEFNAGDVLLKVDPVPYLTALREAKAALRQQELSLERMRQEWETEKIRHEALSQTAALSERDLVRAQELQRKGVGSKSEVERAERLKIEAVSARDLHARELELFPLRIQEMEAMTETARAALDRARRSVEQTELKAPFAGSVKAKRVSAGQYVSAGSEIARFAEHAALEITVPIDSQDALHWLRCQDSAETANPATFPPVEQVDCEIHWTEDPAAAPWRGRLDRIAGYDEATRMVNVVIRHDPAQHEGFPLLAGMFCRVAIPGRAMEQVVRIPRESVTFDDHVYIAVEGRLRSVPVTVAREEGGFAYISEGLAANDLVVLTRLVDPLDNTLLKIDMAELPATGDAPAPSAAL